MNTDGRLKKKDSTTNQDEKTLIGRKGFFTEGNEANEE
jgi:hypothetical protein